MSGDSYRITDQKAVHFITCTIVHWIDLFSRREYWDIIVDSLNYCVKHKGLHIFAWVIMSNHIHMVIQVEHDQGISGFLRDFKKFTSKRFAEIIECHAESRRYWLMDKFSFEARKTKRAEKYKIWKDSNHAMNLTNIDIMQKINYIHDNPVRAGWVEFPDEYLYSSARDYAGRKGLVDIVVI